MYFLLLHIEQNHSYCTGSCQVATYCPLEGHVTQRGDNVCGIMICRETPKNSEKFRAVLAHLNHIHYSVTTLRYPRRKPG